MLNWTKTNVDHWGIPTTAEVTSTTLTDHTMRFFRISKDRSHWIVDVSLVDRGTSIRFPTKKACRAFVDSYTTQTDTAIRDYHKFDIRGYGPGWWRDRSAWLDVAREA